MTDWIQLPADQELLDELWYDHPEGVVLDVLLAAAQQACEAYAPTRQPYTQVPKTWKLAVLMQARDLRRSLSVDGESQFGPDGFPVAVYPVSRTVKSLLRPSAGAGKRGAF